MTLEHGAVRERLVATTLDLMDKGGLEAVKARVVANAVGVSVGTLYNLYGTIDGLVVAANLQIFDALNTLGRQRMRRVEQELAASSQAVSGRDGALLRLLGLAQAYVEFVAANAGRWSALLAFNRSRGVLAAPADYHARQDSLIDIVGDALLTTPLGPQPARRRVAARALWSAVHGIVSTNYFGVDERGARARTWAQIELLVTAFVDGICLRPAGE